MENFTLRVAGEAVVDADDGEDFQSESTWRENLTKAIRALEALLDEKGA